MQFGDLCERTDPKSTHAEKMNDNPDLSLMSQNVDKSQVNQTRSMHI